MKKIWLFALLCMAFSHSHAADWKLVNKSDTVAAYFDEQGIARTQNKIKVWVLWDYVSPQKTDSSPQKQYLSLKELSYYDCAERTRAPVQAVFYPGPFGTGESVETTVRDPSKVLFVDVVPDTVGESMLDRACAIARQKFSPSPDPAPTAAKRARR
jgi:hypothetical protein